MCNRSRCEWCRHGVNREAFAFYGHWSLCPEHKRLRNRLQREAARANRI
jgi:hypothetical protein